MIHIPIQPGNRKTQKEAVQFFGALLGTFVFGMLMGIWGNTVSLPSFDGSLKSQLSAVGELTQGAGETQGEAVATDSAQPLAIVENGDEAPSESAPLEDIAESDAGAVLITTQAEREDVIMAQQTIVERLTRQMAQIKNASLELIGQFDQNCGNWNDTCARPYADTLEKNNVAYERLTKERNTEMLTLLRYQTALEEAR